jgi:hypothetical protein
MLISAQIRDMSKMEIAAASALILPSRFTGAQIDDTCSAATLWRTSPQCGWRLDGFGKGRAALAKIEIVPLDALAMRRARWQFGPHEHERPHMRRGAIA